MVDVNTYVRIIVLDDLELHMDVQETYASSINQRYISTQDLSRTCTQMYLPNQENVAHKYMYVFRILSLPIRLLILYTSSQHTLSVARIRPYHPSSSQSIERDSISPSVRPFVPPPTAITQSITHIKYCKWCVELLLACCCPRGGRIRRT